MNPKSIYLILLLLFSFSNCKEQPHLKVVNTINDNTQNREIHLIGIGVSSGMTNPNYINEQSTLIILRDMVN